MQVRRERILDCARDLIAEEGFDALNLRSLAERAGVTVPTIYNLIGNKSALLRCLFEDSVPPLDDIAEVLRPEDPVAGLETFADRIVATLGSNENYHRAEYLARQHLARTGDAATIDLLKRSQEVLIEACRRTREIGLTCGNISARQLATQIYQNTRLAHSDWARGRISLTALRTQVLLGTYFCIAADAAPEYHAALLGKIAEFDPPRRLSSREP